MVASSGGARRSGAGRHGNHEEHEARPAEHRKQGNHGAGQYTREVNRLRTLPVAAALALVSSVPAAAAAGDAAPTGATTTGDTTPRPIGPGALPGWRTGHAPAKPALAPGPPMLDAILLPLGSGFDVENVFVAGGPVMPFVMTDLTVRIGRAGGGLFAMSIPVVFASGGPPGVGLGSVGLEEAWTVAGSSGDGWRPWRGALRLWLPTATNPRWFAMVPGRDLGQGGLEAAYSRGWHRGAFELAGELGGGVYVNSEMPLRASVTLSGTWRIDHGPFRLFAQLDPWLIVVPDADPAAAQNGGVQALFELGGAAGVVLRLTRVAITLAYQRVVVNHANDNHVWLSFDVAL